MQSLLFSRKKYNFAKHYKIKAKYYKMKKIATILVALMAIAVSAEAKTVKKTFTVNGLCDMCQTRIQKAARSVSGVLTASWNQKTKVCSVVFDDKKTSVDKVQKAIAAAGHDTGKYKATAAAYNKLPGCCKYRK